LGLIFYLNYYYTDEHYMHKINLGFYSHNYNNNATQHKLRNEKRKGGDSKIPYLIFFK